MAITEPFADSASIGTTEVSLPRNATYDIDSPQTDDGVYEVYLDLSAMAAGDVFEFKRYEKVLSAGTQRLVDSRRFSGPQGAPHFVTETIILMHGFDFTLKKIAGTDRTIAWSIRRVA